ncbi:MAG: hypothetical protein QM676_11065 [Novosphingobium sp.]
MRRLLLLAVLALAACDKPTPAEKAADDARDIAMVEAAQHNYGPPVALDPSPITLADRERARLIGAGCSFEAEGQSDPVLIAQPKHAVMKLGRELTAFASDNGSTQLPLGTWAHYVGKEGSLRINKAAGEGGLGGQGGVEWQATLTVTDQHDRTVYSSPGRLRCGA